MVGEHIAHVVPGQVGVVLVLIVMTLVLVKWLTDKRSRERGRDPDMEDSPMDERPKRPFR